jgi:hypothetical protein
MASSLGLDRVLPPAWRVRHSFPCGVDGLERWWPWIDRQLGIPEDAVVTCREITPVDLLDSCNSSWGRVVVDYQDRSGVSSSRQVRFKFAPVFQSWTEGIFFGTSCQHTAEVAFYRRYAADAPCRTPRCYGAFAAPLTVRMCVIQEDLAGVHLEELDHDPDAVEHARLSIVALAKLHARFWRSTQPTASEDRGYLRTSPLRPLALRSVKRHQSSAKIPPGRASGLNGPLVPLFDHLLRHAFHPPLTYIHGDFRRGNVVIVNTDAGKEACLIDWAVSRWGNGAFDVAFYLTFSLTTEDHGRCSRELLDLYYETVVAQRPGHEMDYPYARFYDDYLQGSLLTALALSVPGMQGEVVLNEHNYLKCLTSGMLWGNRLLEIAQFVDFARLEELLKPVDPRLDAQTVRDIWEDAGTRVRDGSAALLTEWQSKVAVSPGRRLGTGR